MELCWRLWYDIGVNALHSLKISHCAHISKGGLMRKILEYPQIKNENLDVVKNLIDSVVENPNGDGSYELQELNRITGKTHTLSEFGEYWGWTDLDSIAKKVLTPEPPYVRNLEKDEIIEIVSIIKSTIISDDNKAEYYIELLHKSLSLPDVLKYIRLEDSEETITDNLLHASLNSVITL